jgi:hypothetical protein
MTKCQLEIGTKKIGAPNGIGDQVPGRQASAAVPTKTVSAMRSPFPQAGSPDRRGSDTGVLEARLPHARA